MGPVLDLGAVFRRQTSRAPAPRKKRVWEIPLPTPQEAAVLAQLWEQGPMTSVDLYTSLPPRALEGLTAEGFWQVLHDMARKGLLEESLITPQNLLMVGLGPFVFPVELSGKNRRNRIWLYKPLVERQELLAYLEAQLYLAARDSFGPSSPPAHQLEELLDAMRTTPPEPTRFPPP